ncbi:MULTISPECIES: phage tail tape measure protein [Clostridium]|uniref:phage tail tape measure protein n=1 Tax=Clostridium TaxID=1485 RepID=UPI000DFAD44C|nr:phage tail tape measure protein [Clostridium sporogenes]MCW6085583.1 phage tail tape measure protein [Clostridium sporogenes]STC76894.1 phage tail tape measure protein, TP901 family [Clostridium botulinum]
MEIFRLFGSIFVKDEASKALDKVSKKTDETSKKVQMSEKTFGKVSSGLNKVGSNMMKFVVAPLGILGVGAIKASTDFKGGMAKVSTIADTTKVPINKLSEGALKLSKDFGVGATEITESMYQAISASVPTEKALGFVAVATKAAKGGFSTASVAVDGLSTVLNSYGMEADKADKIANQMLITQNKGKTTFDELASSVGKVTPIASQLGVTTEELFSSLASTTAQGLSTSESVTALKAAMSNVIKPSEQASKIAQQLGIDFSASALKSKGWSKFLSEIKEKTGGNTEVMGQLFGSTEALNSILMLTSDNGMNIYNDTMKEMKTNTHALDDAFNKMSNTPGEKFKKALNSMKVAAIQFGDVLAPAFDKVTNVISNFGNKLSNMTPQQKKFIVEIAKMALGISAFVLAAGKIMNAVIFFKQFSTAIKGVSIAGKALTMGTVGWVAIIVAGVAMLVAFIISHWDQIKQVTATVWNAIKTTIETVLSAISTVISTVFNVIKTVISTVWEAIKTVITVVVLAIKFVIETTFTLLVTIIRVPLEIIKALIMTVWNYIGGYITNVINGIKSIITTVWNAIASVTSSIWNAIKGVITNVWNGIKAIIVPIINSIKQIVTNVWNNIKAVTSSVFNAIKSVASSVWNSIKSVISSVVNSIKSVVTSVWNGIKSITSSVWNGIKNAMTKPVEAAKNTISKTIEKIKGFFTKLKLKFPKIEMPKLPHFKLDGKFSLTPPSVPKLGVDWYSEGGIFTKPTIFGGIGVGDANHGHGNNAEAVLPLNVLWDKLDKNFDNLIQNLNNNNGKSIDQHIVINSPKALNPSEIARENRKVLQELALQL